MPSSSVVPRFLVAGITCLLAGCAMNPQQLAYRERLELGFVTPEDIERFKTSEHEQLALVAEARGGVLRNSPVLDQQLMQAAGTGDVTRITALLAEGAQVNATDALGNTALLNAVREGDVESARVLLKAGAYADGRGGAMPPLAAAALRGHTIVARLLIRNDANVDAVGANELSALMNAVKLNHLGVAKVLIEAGANTRVLDRAGDNLLAVAVTEGYAEMLALLLKLGVPADLADRNGLTALYWADYLKRPDLSRLLLDAGADPARKKTEIRVSQSYQLGEF